jgi:hypothetical protein
MRTFIYNETRMNMDSSFVRCERYNSGMLNDLNPSVETASTISCHTTMVRAALQSSTKYTKEK